MVLIFCATLLFAILPASEASEMVSHSLPNVLQTKTAEKYKKFTQHLSALDGKNTEKDLVNPKDYAMLFSQASLKYMTAKASIQMAAESNRQAMKILKDLACERTTIYTMIEKAQSMMKLGSETTLHATVGLTTYLLVKDAMNENAKALENLCHMYEIHPQPCTLVHQAGPGNNALLPKPQLPAANKKALMYELQGMQQLIQHRSSDRYWNSDLYTMLYMNYHKTVKCLETVSLYLIRAAEANNYYPSYMKQLAAGLASLIKAGGYQRQTAEKVAEIVHKVLTGMILKEKR
ncbi:unnamed protein product [Nippostrongylus brasiliensis]|uniref:DUF4439 domain-containing protein n=1 Tax=Nippostrongylus brasiliensis TaxID=27835 RepID=A0A158R198_NIPBR|nr:unnamed protein product [Nippostrongylus brasiliensis]